MQFTCEQLALEQKRDRRWHMWLRGERCRSAPDDEGMRMRGRLERGAVEGDVCHTRVCQCFATGHAFVILSASAYRDNRGCNFFPRHHWLEFKEQRWSCSVKASDGWVVMLHKSNFSSLPLPRLEHLSAVEHAKWAQCQSHSQPQGTLVFLPCLMKWQNNRFAYAETGVVTGLAPLDLLCVKERICRGKNMHGKKLMTNSCLEVFRLWWALKSAPSAPLLARSDKLN